ncbi:MAG: isoprenyl transferase [bacterium]
MTNSDIEKHALPRHVAIIMDGNGRWAKKRLMNRTSGHREGGKRVDEITQFCREIGIEYLTLYAFSVENWNRPDSEIKVLMKLLNEYLDKKRKVFAENNIRLNFIGDLSKLPEKEREKSIKISAETGKYECKMTLNVALSYGGREEIVRAVRNIGYKIMNNDLKPSDIDKKVFENYLYTSGMPAPDFLIRTSGEQRVSNFLLWQLAYTEFYFPDKLWPDFKVEDFKKALSVYASRERRFGKTAQQIKKEK